jgi:16S rRNA (uracil1498-N3)-methyltransferase
MYIPRIYQPSELLLGESFTLDAQASHHITNVLRLKNGASLILFNGFGGEYTATLLSKNTVHIEKHSEKNTESPVHIHLGQALCRNEKMDYVIQKAVELGVHSITPLISKRSENKISEKRLERWERIIISASEQSGRTYIPKIANPTSLYQWLSTESSDLKFILNPIKGLSINDFDNSPHSISILIGPESGFDEKEVDLAVNSGFQSLTLGPRILRTETAALATLSVLQSKFGDFSFLNK